MRKITRETDFGVVKGLVATVATATAFIAGPGAASAQAAPCDPPVQNEIACENSKPGDPASEWDVSGAGDASIQGFATEISVDQGETVGFKVDTDATDYRLDIYRLGYYGGDGARQVDTVQPSAALPQSQPGCDETAATGLIDCASWALSADWQVPGDAVSGIYIAKLVREDGPVGASHVVFVVRDDDGNSDLLFQTADTTWQAYNDYGGKSLYVGGPAGPPRPRAYAVSYNRPFTTRAANPEDWLFNAEYPMLRWLEANGYDVSYFTGVDSDRRGAEIAEHDAFLSVGHDEYWSAAQRDHVEAARDAGVDLAFFSGNEIFWKTRWADNHRTLVSYKESHDDAKIDPSGEWTGTWRDPRPFNPEGADPENALTGQLFTVNCCSYAIQVPAADGRMRLWRNTSVASLGTGQTATLAADTLGYEWDEDLDNGFRPAGLVPLSSTTVNVPQRILDYSSDYGPGEATHRLSLYRHGSGALVFGAGTIQWSWGLDSNHDRGSGAPDPRMQQATVNLFADMGVQPGSLQPGLTAAAASTDTTAPTSQIDSPDAGDTVERGQTTTISGTASDAGGEVGVVEVSVNGGATWHRAEGRESWSYSWTPASTGPATIKTRAADDSGNLESSGAGVTVDVEPRSCPCSIWDDSVTPPVTNDTGSVELGVKFRSDEPGFITGLRFYKGAANTGTHVGHLWSASGALLAQATFIGESATGWQQVELDTPVAIAAGTTYVASYHAPNGNYAFSGGHFAGGSVDSPPLHALGEGVDGGNGVFGYGPSGTFPTNSFNSSNYWVDVVFDTAGGVDTTPPTVETVSPAGGATGVAAGTNVTARFSEAMDPATIDADSFELRDGDGDLVPANVSYSAANRTATLDPNGQLESSTTYTATVRGGAGGVEDDADPGNPLAADHSWSFTTAGPPPPPPDEGPGGPILVISGDSNPFGRYYAEILRNEGLNEFEVSDLSGVTASDLDDYDVVVLGETPLSAAQVSMLTDYVQAGGNLVAMRPDPDLAALLGLTDTGMTLSDAYLEVDDSTPPGEGIVGESIQYHGTADRYTLSGATSVATLFSGASTPTSPANPAVTVRSVGANGGQAAAFTYDLARSVVLTRQGNPAWVNQNRDGQAGPNRSNDLFYGDAAGDPQPDWVNLDKVDIPQADEQQRLLANLIQHVNLDRKPLPRFWYFPRDEKAAIVMTGDDHANGGTDGRFDAEQAESAPGCSVVAWECVRSTSYVYPNTTIAGAQGESAADFEADGFEVALHPDTGCTSPSPAAYRDNVLVPQLAQFAASYPGVSRPVTNRNHCIAWIDWTAVPEAELEQGIRLDANYYYWPESWLQDRAGMFTGSGMPMRFAKLDGSMIDVYQSATQMTDESGQEYPATVDALLDKALGAEGYFGAFNANMHTDTATPAAWQAIVDSAQARGVPVISARQLLEWLDARNASSFADIAWNSGTLSFEIAPAAGASGLRAMLPTSSATGELSAIKRGGSAVAYTTETVKGIEYARFDAQAGAYEATYETDDDAPVISGVSATANGDGTATVTWQTDEPADSRVDYGTSAGSLGQSASESALVTSHSVELTGLAPNTTYHFRVTSADDAANEATSPATPAAPATFVTPSASFGDTTASDFGAGTHTGVHVTNDANGEVILKPQVAEEFSGGPGLPADLGYSGVWGPGGSATVGGGALAVNGAYAGTSNLYGSGRSLEFVATFLGGTPNAHIGFGVDFNDDPHWQMFSVKGDGNFYARTNAGGPETPLPSSLLGSPHRYRIDWNAGNVEYYVDGALVATHNVSFGGTQMRPLASEFNAGGAGLSVDWLRMTPYAGSGTFTSRVFDAGSVAEWGALTWSADVPAGTSLALSVRTGDTPTPDGGWSSYAPVAASGGDIPGSSRYVQYRAELSSSDPETTAILRDVTISYHHNPVAVDDNETVAEDSGANAFDVLANDTDADGGAKTIEAVTQGNHGSVAITSGGGDLTYTPAANYCGPDTFTYTLNGGSSADVDVTVTCADDAPTAVDDSKTVNEDSGATAIDVLANDPDPDGGQKQVVAKTNGAHGTVAITGGGSGLTYEPDSDYCGPDTFTYTLNGGSSADVDVTVTCADDQPTAVDDSRTVDEDSSATAMNVLANDLNADGGPISIQTASDPANGTVAITGGGSNLTYKPDPDYCNTDASGPGSGPDDTFTYTLNGGSTATVSVEVACQPDGGDTTDPEIEIRDPYEAGRYSIEADPKPELHADYECTDAGSGIASCVGTVADGALFDRSSAGTKTFTVTATDNAGNTHTETVTYRVFTFRNFMLDDNPIAYYRMGDAAGSQAMRAEVGPNGEYKNGQSSEPFGISGDGDRARRFTGADGYGYANGIEAPRSYTLSAFFRLDDSGPAMILQHGSAGAIWHSGGMLRFRPVDWLGVELDTGAGSVTPGTWHHVAATYNWVPNPNNPQLGTGTARLYLDGEHMDARTGDRQTSGTSTFYVGYGDKAPWLRGVVDEVAYYPRALSHTHLHEIWLADPPPAEAPAAGSGSGTSGGAGGTGGTPAPAAGAQPTEPAPSGEATPAATPADATPADAGDALTVEGVSAAGKLLRVEVACGDADCAGRMSARRGTQKLGMKEFEIDAGETEFVDIKLTKNGRRAVKRGGTVTIAVAGDGLELETSVPLKRTG
jgi:hypothetical protein